MLQFSCKYPMPSNPWALKWGSHFPLPSLIDLRWQNVKLRDITTYRVIFLIVILSLADSDSDSQTNPSHKKRYLIATFSDRYILNCLLRGMSVIKKYFVRKSHKEIVLYLLKRPHEYNFLGNSGYLQLRDDNCWQQEICWNFSKSVLKFRLKTKEDAEIREVVKLLAL